jgi:hypothetical protein
MGSSLLTNRAANPPVIVLSKPHVGMSHANQQLQQKRL